MSHDCEVTLTHVSAPNAVPSPSHNGKNLMAEVITSVNLNHQLLSTEPVSMPTFPRTTLRTPLTSAAFTLHKLWFLSLNIKIKVKIIAICTPVTLVVNKKVLEKSRSIMLLERSKTYQLTGQSTEAREMRQQRRSSSDCSVCRRQEVRCFSQIEEESCTQIRMIT